MTTNINKEEKSIKQKLARLDKQYNWSKFVGAIFSLFISLGLGIQLDVMFYWIPASFLLMFIWMIYSFSITRKKSLTEPKARESMELVKKISTKRWWYGASLLTKSVSPVMMAVTISYGINIVILLLHFSHYINLPFSGLLELAVIFSISIYFAIATFGVDRFPTFFSRYSIPSMRRFSKLEKNSKIPKFIRKHALKILIAFSILFLIGFVIILFWVIILIFSYVSNVSFLILLATFQFIIILLLSSFFSGQQVKSELEKSLLEIDKIKSDELDANYLFEAVRFTRYSIDDTFKFFILYQFKPHKKYLQQLIEEEKPYH